IELENIEDSGMTDILESQKSEANSHFGKCIEKNYGDWFKGDSQAPLMTHTIFKDLVAKEINKKTPTLLVVIDNLRHDQWKCIEGIINLHYKKDKEIPYFSILPTATQY